MEEMKSLTLNGKRYDSFPDQTARENLKKKIPGPEGGAVVGQYLRVADVDDDGNITAVEAVDAPAGGGGGLSSTAAALLITILRNGVYSTDQSGNITALEAALASSGSGGGDSGETEKTLIGISATYSGGDVTVGTAVTDLTGIVVTAEYSDGSTETVTGYTLSGTIAEGSNTVTVSYGGMTTTFTVTGVTENTGGDETGTGWENGVAYDFGSKESTDGYFLNKGNTAVFNGYTVSDYFDCLGASTFTCSSSSGNMQYNAFYDSAKTYISNFSINVVGNNVDVPSNAAFIRVTWRTDIGPGQLNVIPNA